MNERMNAGKRNVRCIYAHNQRTNLVGRDPFRRHHSSILYLCTRTNQKKNNSPYPLDIVPPTSLSVHPRSNQHAGKASNAREDWRGELGGGSGGLVLAGCLRERDSAGTGREEKGGGGEIDGEYGASVEGRGRAV